MLNINCKRIKLWIITWLTYSTGTTPVPVLHIHTHTHYNTLPRLCWQPAHIRLSFIITIIIIIIKYSHPHNYKTYARMYIMYANVTNANENNRLFILVIIYVLRYDINYDVVYIRFFRHFPSLYLWLSDD